MFVPDAGTTPSEEIYSLQTVSHVDLDAFWGLLSSHVTPYEVDRSVYHTSKYPSPLFVRMNPVAWTLIVENQDICGAEDLMLGLGFALAPGDAIAFPEFRDYETTASEGCAPPFALSGDCGTDGTESTGGGLGDDYTDEKLIKRASFHLLLSHLSSLPVPADGSNDPCSCGWIRFRAIKHVEMSPHKVRSPCVQTPLCQSIVASHATASNLGTGIPRGSISATGVSFPNLSIPGTPVDPTACTEMFSSVDGPETESPAACPGYQEVEIKEAKKQLPPLAHRESSREMSASATALDSVQSSPQEPQIIARPDLPLVASTHCHAPVFMPVSYLDPNCAPYVVSLGTGAGRTLLACTIVARRFVFFVAPPRRRGMRPVALFCTRDGMLYPYTRAVWLEYRPQDPPNTLTHHALNQLLHEIPLPPSGVSGDIANPSEAEIAKSESAFDDDNTCFDTDTAATLSEHGFEIEQRVPLTKEMLRCIQNGSVTVRRSSVRGGTSAVGSTSTHVGGEREGEGVAEDDEGDDMDMERVAATTWASQLWLGPTRADVLGSTVVSTGQPTSYIRGAQSGYSDEEATQCAFNCTELSSTSSASLTSIESTTSASAGIMACRGWVRHWLGQTSSVGS